MSKKKLMFDLTNNSTNNPITLPGVYSDAVTKSNSIEGFELIANAKDRVKIGMHEFGDLLQADGCSPTDTGAGVLSEKEVSVDTFQVYLKLCQATVEQSFLSERMPKGSNNPNFLPSDFNAYLSEKIAEEIAADLEEMSWQGVGSGSTYPLNRGIGLEKKLNEDSDVIDVVAFSGSITSTNVISELSRVYAAKPATLKKKDAVIYASADFISNYELAIAATTGNAFNTADLKLQFMGIPIVEADMSEKKVILTRKNLFKKITDLMEDFQDITVIPQFNTTGIHEIVISGAMKWAVDYPSGVEVVFYH